MIAKYLWKVQNSDIWICFPLRFMEGYGKGSGWVFVLSMDIEDGGGGSYKTVLYIEINVLLSYTDVKLRFTISSETKSNNLLIHTCTSTVLYII